MTNALLWYILRYKLRKQRKRYATNCNSSGRAPKIVGRDAGFHAFATDGSVMNMGEEFATFEDAAMFLETVFSWEVKING